MKRGILLAAVVGLIGIGIVGGRAWLHEQRLCEGTMVYTPTDDWCVADTPPVDNVSASYLMRVYMTTPEGYRGKYEGRWVRVTGTVARTGGKTVYLRTADRSEGIWPYFGHLVAIWPIHVPFMEGDEVTATCIATKADKAHTSLHLWMSACREVSH